MGVEGGSRGREVRAAARLLVEQGSTIQSDFDAALDSLEGHTAKFNGELGFLLDVYALIRGPQASPRLQRFRESPELNPLGLATIGIDEATALALHLTSYASAKREPMRYSAAYEPREDLDQFLVAWLRNDREWVEGKIGPAGKAVLSSLLQGTDWDHLRAKLWPTESPAAAIGFRFDVPGRWSQPSFTLDDDLVAQRRGGTDLQQLGDKFSFPTVFTDSSGSVCGSHEISFVRATANDSHGTYRINNSDLEDLLLLFSSCAVR